MKRMGARESRRMQEQMMKRMGLKMDEVPNAVEVTIRTADKLIRISNPSVTKYELQGQTFFQVAGTVEESATESAVQRPAVQLPEEDVLLVAQQAGVSPEEAKKALEATGGDLAQAIVLLKRS
jgi:nascent polypeptide-associated complex subunit alpha